MTGRRTKKFKIDFPLPSQHDEVITAYTIEGCRHCDSTKQKIDKLSRKCKDLCLKVAVYNICVNGSASNGCITRTDLKKLKTTMVLNKNGTYSYPNSNYFMSKDTYTQLLEHTTFPYVFVRNGNEIKLYGNSGFQSLD
jgi:glutaredoxin